MAKRTAEPHFLLTREQPASTFRNLSRRGFEQTDLAGKRFPLISSLDDILKKEKKLFNLL
jgi:hypothetical protein